MGHAPRVLVFVTLLTALSGVWSIAAACTCVTSSPPRLCEQRTASVIFIGKIASAVNDARVRVSVLDAFKGLGAERTVELPSGNESMCGYSFEVGETYLIYAERDGTNSLTTSLCSGNTRLSDVARPVVQDLEDLRRGLGRAEIFGTLYGPRDSSGIDSRLPNIKVFARREGKALETKTNRNGDYHIAVDAGGVYELSAELPSSLTLDRGPFNKAPSVQVVPHACVSFSLIALNNARISGRLVAPAGVDVQGIPLALWPTGPIPRGRSVESDASGRFEITGIEPGEYVLGINRLCGPTQQLPFPRTFFPGVPDEASATRYRIDGPQKIDNQDLPFSGPAPTRTISVVTVGEDGRPLKGATVLPVNRNGNRCSYTHQPPGAAQQTDEAGRIAVTVFVGEEWTLISATRTDTGDPTACAADVRIGPDSFPEALRVVLSRPTCRLVDNARQIERMTRDAADEYRTVAVHVAWKDGRAIEPTTIVVQGANYLSVVQLIADDQGHVDVPLPAGRLFAVSARLNNVACSTVPVVVDTRDLVPGWRRFANNESLGSWTPAGPFVEDGPIELLFDPPSRWCR